MSPRDSHLALLHDERVPSHFLDEFQRDLEAESLAIHRQALPSRAPQASLETLVLPAIALWLLKPYLDGFLKQAGSDHYALLKKALKDHLWKRLFGENRTLHFAIVTARGEKKPEHSPLFSMMAPLDDGRVAKLLIRDGCSEEEFSAGTSAFLNLLVSYHSDSTCSEATIDLHGEPGNYGFVLLDYDAEAESLRVVDPVRLAKERQKR